MLFNRSALYGPPHRLLPGGWGGWLLFVLLLLTGCGGNGSDTSPAVEEAKARIAAGRPTTVVRWSDPNSGLPKTAADLVGVSTVVIPAGVFVSLDMVPPQLPHLRIEGTLVFLDTQDIELKVDSIDIRSTGTLQIGSVITPQNYRATITLTGLRSPADTGITNDGISRGLNINGGKLYLYGRLPVPTWTQLNDHVPKFGSVLTLKDTVNWSAGDLLAIAPTDFYGQVSTERPTVASVNGNVVTVTGAIKGDRWGKMQYLTSTGMSLTPEPGYTPPATPAPTELDERAEVANLSRRIIIQGANDTDWNSYGFGAHVMIMGLSSRVTVNGVEFRRVGQAGKIARYPIHWHLLSYDTVTGTELGDASTHTITNSAIWNSSQRCIVIHGTNGIKVTNNICHDIKGHAIFLEDGTERRNVFTNNLVLKVRSPNTGNLLKIHEGPQVYQAGPSGFWLTNPDNTVVNNHVADAHGNGFWLSFPLTPLGLSRTVPMFPASIPLGTFTDNTAHTNGGPGQLMEWIPKDDNVAQPELTLGTLVSHAYNPTSNNLPCVDAAGNQTSGCSTEVRVKIERSTLFKNGSLGGHGAYRNRTIWPDYLEWVTADNVGTHFAGAIVGSGTLERSLLVGTSLNVVWPYPSGMPGPAGLATYHSTLRMANNTLVNFPFIENTTSGAFLTDDYYLRPVEKGTFYNPNNRLINSFPGYRTLPPILQPVRNRAENWALAGALWDPYGYWGTPNNYLVFDVPFLTHGMNCSYLDTNVPGNHKNGRSCSGEYFGVHSFQTDVDTNRYAFSAAIQVERQDPSGNTVDTWDIGDGYPSWVNDAGQTVICDRNNPPPEGKSCSYQLGSMRHFAAVQDNRYVLNFPTHAWTPRYVAMNVSNAYRVSDSMLLGVPFDGRYTAAGYSAAGMEYNREYPMLDPQYYPDSTPSKPSAVRYFKRGNSMADVLADPSGATVWQDSANNRVWLRHTGTPYSATAQAAAASNTDSSLLYIQSIVLHPEGVCTDLTGSQATACIERIRALP